MPLYLLDTNIPKNSADDRKITGALYGGDRELRIQQEIILGIGGMRALHALGIRPTVCHMNEGHSAFLGPGARAHGAWRSSSSAITRRANSPPRATSSPPTRPCRRASTASIPA